MFEEYDIKDLTKRQGEYIGGMRDTIEIIDKFISQRSKFAEDPDTTILERLQDEIACDALVSLKEYTEGVMFDIIVSMMVENACKVMEMPRKKAEKKYGKRFVGEVLG